MHHKLKHHLGMWLPKCGNHGSNIATSLLLPFHHHQHRQCNPSTTTIERPPQRNDNNDGGQVMPSPGKPHNAPPASSLTSTKGAMSQLAMWQPDDNATTVTHTIWHHDTTTTWHHDTTTTATPPHVYTIPKDLPPPTNGSPPPHRAIAHKRRWTAHK